METGRPKPLNEDIALLLGALLAGAGVKGLTGDYASWVMLFVGLVLILGVMYQRVRDSRPPWVRGDIGISVLSHDIDGPSATFTVAFRASPDTDLRLICDAPLMNGHGAPVKMVRDGEARGVGNTWDLYVHRNNALVWLSEDPPDDKPYQKEAKEVTLTIVATRPIRSVLVEIANPRWRRRFLRKAGIMP
jgi:hypothetical protein